MVPACRGARQATCAENLAKNRAQGLTHFCCRAGGPWCALKPDNGLRPPGGRPRAPAGAIARPTGAAGTGSKTFRNVLSLNRWYIYGMTTATGRRPFSMLGDQQLLEQTRRLAANQRALEVHILNHLDEIDRRNLALRRGFSSLFDYAVRELRFSDAAAQRRIQTMRLCRRHGWVRAMLQSGDLSLTSAAQFETAFAAAERECRRASPNIDQERCHDLLGLPASPSAAGDRDADESGAEAGVASAAAMTASATHGVVAADQEARSPRDAGGHEDRHTGSDRCRRSSDKPAAVDARPAAPGSQPVGRLHSSAATSGAAPASNTATLHAPPQAPSGRAPRIPAASHAAAQHRGARHADALPARLESNGAASLSPAPSRAPGPAAPSSDHLPAAPLLPPASRAAPVSLPVVAPAETRPTAAPAPAPSRGDPMAERSAGAVSAAPLLHPRRQRELIEQAAGMTTRQVAGLLATAAPQVVPPRDTLRAVAPDRFTLKVSIDQECEQGLRQLKDLRSHLDPRMSWGDLVARLVREAVARHDPRGGGRRRKRVGSTAASSRRERTRTPDAVPAAAPAGGGGSDTPAPQGETAAREQPRAAMSPNAAPVRGSAPEAPGTRAGAATLATPAAAVAPVVESHPTTRSAPEPALATPAAAAAPEGRSAGARVPCPAARVPASGAPRLTVPAAPAGGARQAGPSGAPEAAAAPQSTSGGAADGSDAAPVSPGASPAPKFARGGPADGTDAAPVPPGAPPAPKFASGGPADGTDAAPVSPATPPAPKCTSGGAADGSDAAPVSPGASPAPKFARGGPADGTDAAPVPPGAPPAPKFASGGPADGTDAAPIPPATPPAPESAGSLPTVYGAGGARTGASPQFARDAPRGPRRPPVRRPIPAAVRRHVWLRDGARCCYRDPLTGRRCDSSHLLQIHHLLPVAEGGGPEPDNLALRCFPTTACATATDRRRRRSRRGSATSTPWPRWGLATRRALLQAIVDPGHANSASSGVRTPGAAGTEALLVNQRRGLA